MNTQAFSQAVWAGYFTVTPDLQVRVRSKLRDEYRNGHTYYPLEGRRIRLPRDPAAHPDRDLLQWHGTRLFGA